MCEVRNNGVQSLFIMEEKLAEPETEEQSPQMEDLLVDQNELLKLMKDLDVRKMTAPDRVTGWMCRAVCRTNT